MGFKIAHSQSVVYKHDSEHSSSTKKQGKNKHFTILREAVISLRLGALVVHFNKDQDAKEQIQQRLQNSIKYHSAFSAKEQTRLQNYLLRRLKALEDMQEVKAELARLALNKKRRVRYILLSIAFADQTYTKQQQNSLEQLYLALGLNKYLLKADVAAFSIKQTVAKQDTDNNEIRIPAHQSSLKLQAIKPTKQLEIETNQQTDYAVSAAFIEEKTPVTKTTTTSTSEMVSASYGQQSLSDKRDRLYKQLIKQEQWTQAAFKRLCKQHKLVPYGAMEMINNWSMQHMNKKILSQKGNMIRVNTRSMATIQG